MDGLARKQGPKKIEEAVRRSRGSSNGRGTPAAADSGETGKGGRQSALLEIDLGRRCAFAGAVAWATLALLGTLIFVGDPSFSDPLGISAFLKFLLPSGPALAGLAVAGAAFRSKRGAIIHGRWKEAHNLAMFMGLGLSAAILTTSVLLQVTTVDIAAAIATYPFGVFAITLGMLSFILTWDEWSLRKILATACAIIPAGLFLFHQGNPANTLLIVVWEYHVSGALYMVAGVLFVISMTATTGAQREIVKGANERVAMEAARLKARDRELMSAITDNATRAEQLTEELAAAEASRRTADDHISAAERVKAEAQALLERATKSEAAAATKLAGVEGQVAALDARARESAAMNSQHSNRERELTGLEERLLNQRASVEGEARKAEADRKAVQEQLAHAKREREAARASLEAAEKRAMELQSEREALQSAKRQAEEALQVAQARSTSSDGARNAALAEVQGKLESERASLDRERKELNEQKTKVERIHRQVQERAVESEEKQKELARLEQSLAATQAKVSQEKAQVESMERKAKGALADAEAKAKSYQESYAQVRDLEGKASQAQSIVKGLEERIVAREARLKQFEADLEKRSQQQLMERKALASDKEKVASLEARLKEREAALFELEETPDFAREAMKVLGDELGMPAALTGASKGSKGAGIKAAANPSLQKTQAAPGPEAAVGRFSLGSPRLNDLCGGGLPKGSSLLVVGPAFCGKETIPLGFVAAGLERGGPAIIVTTVRSPAEIVEEMALQMGSGVRDKMKTLVRWVDASGKGQRGDIPREHVTDVLSPADFAKIKEAIAKHFEAFGKNANALRVIYLPLTESWRNAEPAAARNFLQQLVAAVRKQDGGAIFVAESGIHSSDEIEAIAGMMQGVIRLQEEKEGHSLRAQGLPGTKPHQWIKYRHGPHGLDLGSFELERIR